MLLKNNAILLLLLLYAKSNTSDVDLHIIIIIIIIIFGKNIKIFWCIFLCLVVLLGLRGQQLELGSPSIPISFNKQQFRPWISKTQPGQVFNIIPPASFVSPSRFLPLGRASISCFAVRSWEICVTWSYQRSCDRSMRNSSGLMLRH